MHIYDAAKHTITTHPTSQVGLTLAGTRLSMRARPCLSRAFGFWSKKVLLVSVAVAAASVSLIPRRPSVAWHVMVEVPRRPTTIARKEKGFIVVGFGGNW